MVFGKKDRSLSENRTLGKVCLVYLRYCVGIFCCIVLKYLYVGFLVESTWLENMSLVYKWKSLSITIGVMLKSLQNRDNLSFVAINRWCVSLLAFLVFQQIDWCRNSNQKNNVEDSAIECGELFFLGVLIGWLNLILVLIRYFYRKSMEVA